ncbi:hypothetical protein Mapa_008928 [Marchantia paleacea]|nr:hypothetical protein Mapa_008928 [Marchantia paleacea]
MHGITRHPHHKPYHKQVLERCLRGFPCFGLLKVGIDLLLRLPGSALLQFQRCARITEWIGHISYRRRWSGITELHGPFPSSWGSSCRTPLHPPLPSKKIRKAEAFCARRSTKGTINA